MKAAVVADNRNKIEWNRSCERGSRVRDSKGKKSNLMAKLGGRRRKKNFF